MLLCKGKIMVNVDKGYDYFKEAYAILEKTGTADQCVMKAGLAYEKVKAENGEVLDKMIFMPVVNLHKEGAEAIIDSYLEDVLALARWGKFQVLGHLTLPLRYINENYGEHMTFAHHMDQVEEIFRTIIPKGLGIECNTNRGNEPLPGADILRLYRRLGGEIITLGSDAHRPADVGCFIRQRQELLRECGFRYFTTFTGGKPEFKEL